MTVDTNTKKIVRYILGGVHLDEPETGKLIQIGVTPAYQRHECSTKLKKSPDRVKLLAQYNLAAVQDGTLFELVDERCRAHPKRLDEYRIMLEGFNELASFDRASKRRFFYRGDESCRRPEVALYHKMVAHIELGPEVLIPAGRTGASRFTEVIEFKPPFSPLPYELAETFPAGPAEIPTWDKTMVSYV